MISMVVLTALWGVVGAVNVASANVATAGDLIKSDSSPAVYYLDASLVKHPFHHEREYLTWYSDFDSVKTVPTDEMVSYTLGSTVVVRPGSRLVQYVEVLGDGTWNVSNTPEVYAVGTDGSTHAIDAAATAVSLYGSAWETMIIPLPNYLSANYAASTALTSSSTYPTGTLVKTADAAQVYYVDGTTKRPVTDEGMTGNRFNMDYVLTVEDLTGYTDSTSITAMEDAIANPMTGGSGVAVGTGLTAALAANTPGASVAPISATNVPVMKFNLTASADGAVEVDKISVKRMGVGATGDFAALYLYDGATRLTNGKTLNSTSHMAQFSGLDLSIPAGTTKTLTLNVDISTGTSGNISYFQITSADVETASTVNGSFPLNSNTVTIGSSTAGSVVIDENGSISNPVVGQIGANIAQFKLTAGSGEDVNLNRVTLYQAGSVNNAYLTNMKLYQGNTELGSVASITNKSLIIFDLSANPFLLEKNTNRIFKVTADISGSARNNDTVKIYLEDNADIFAVGAVYGFGASVDSDASNAADDLGYDGNDTSCTTEATCSDSTYSVVQGGQITVAMNGPVASNLAKGATDVVFMNFSITAGINAELRKMRVELHSDAGAGSDIGATAATDASTSDSCATDYIMNVKIVDVDNGESTGAINCSGFTNIDSADGVYYDFTDYFTFDSGETRNFAIMGDLHTSLDADDYYAVLGSSGTRYTTTETAYTLNSADGVKNTDNNQWVTDLVPTTNTTGNQMTVAAASVGWALASNAAAVTIVQGTDDVNLGEFAFNTGQGSDIEISSLAFTGYNASTSPTTANSIPAAAGGCAAGSDGDTYCINMGGDVFSYVNNLISNVRIYDMTDDPDMTNNLNSTSEGFGSTTGKVTFDNMSWTIPAGETHVLRVVGDVSNTAYANGSDGDKYVKLNMAAVGDITAQDTDGTSVTLTDNDLSTAWVITQGNGVATDMGGDYYLTITNEGTLNVTTESNPPVANVIAGTSDVPVMNLRFQSTNESFKVNKIRISEQFNNGGTSTRAIDSVTISYQNEAGDTVTATQAVVSANADFNITDNPIYVASNNYATVNVYYNLEAINQTYNTYTGDIVIARFVAAGNFEAVGGGSSSTKITNSSNNVDQNGNAMTVHGALPTFVVDTSENLTLANGPVDLYRVRVDAAEGGTNVTLKKLSFKLSLTDTVINSSTLSLTNFQILEGSSYGNASALTQGDNNTDSYQVYNGWGATGTTATGIAGGKLSAASGVLYHNIAGQGAAGASASSTHDIIVVFNDDRLVTAGTSKYYILRATAGNVDTGASSNDSMGMYLFDGDSATTAAARIAGSCDLVGDNSTHGATKYCLTDTIYDDSDASNESAAWIIWSDSTGVNGNNTHQDVDAEFSYNSTAATSSKDFFNGYKLKTLDVQRSLN